MLREKRMTRVVTILCAATIIGTGAGQLWGNDTAGGGMYPYLGTGRAVGMGGAFTALADDSGALIWNPAGLVQVGMKGGEIAAEVNDDDMGYFMASYLFRPGDDQMNEAVMFVQSSLDNLGGVDRDDTIFQYTIAQQFDAQTSFGASLKYHGVDLGTLSDEGFSFDLGVLYEVDLDAEPDEEGFVPGLKIGLAALDVNEPSFHQIGNQQRTINVGAAYQLDPGTVVAVDIYDVGDDTGDSELRIGGERLVTDRITVRAGIADSDFSIGLGVMYPSFNVEFGYRRVDHGPDLNMLSLKADF